VGDAAVRPAGGGPGERKAASGSMARAIASVTADSMGAQSAASLDISRDPTRLPDAVRTKMRAVHLPASRWMNPSMFMGAASEKALSPRRAETALAIVGPSEQLSALVPRTHTRCTGCGAALALAAPHATPMTVATQHQASRLGGVRPRRTAGHATTG
jgi:hypothetical protein